MRMTIPLDKDDQNLHGASRARRVTHLKSLLDFLDKHVAVSCKTIYGQDGAVGSAMRESARAFDARARDTYNRKTLGA